MHVCYLGDINNFDDDHAERKKLANEQASSIAIGLPPGGRATPTCNIGKLLLIILLVGKHQQRRSPPEQPMSAGLSL